VNAARRESAPAELTLRERELIVRIGWFIRLRWVAAGGTLVLLFFAWHLFDMHFPIQPVLGTVIAMFFYNALFALIAQNRLKPDLFPTIQSMRLFAMVQVVADLVCLTLLIHWLGGAENPFILFYFFHMVIGSILFRRKYSYYLALVAALLLNGMIWGEYFSLFEHYSYESTWSGSRWNSFDYSFILASVVTASLFISVYFASSIASDLRQKEDELESAYRDLRRLDEEKSYFMRKASHELRSPLSAMQSFVRVLLEGMGGEVSVEQRNILERMQIRLQGLLDLVADLLRLSRLRITETPQGIERFDFCEMVRQVADLFAPWAKEKAIEVSVECQPTFLQGDRESLVEVVSNLISNAVKYTPDGGRVSVALRAPGPKVRFTVQDTGIGIHEEDQPRVFQEFFRARNAKRVTETGTGLGLSITKRIVEMHGGSITFSSSFGEGTRFEVELPCEQLPEGSS